jgi:hypothetical protein
MPVYDLAIHLTITGSNPYQFMDSSVSSGQTYTYRLTAINSIGKEEILGTTQGNASPPPHGLLSLRFIPIPPNLFSPAA